MTAVRLAVPVAALAIAAATALPDRRPVGLRLSGARGALELVNSREGEAAFSAATMKPGDRVTGTVAVTNRSSSTARLFLRSSAPAGRRGRGGGELGNALQLRIEDGGLTRASGTVAAIAGCHDLGLLGPDATRTFHFSASWPRGSSDNAIEGSSVSADEHWFVNEDGAGCVAGERQVAGDIELSPRTRLAISHRRVALSRGRARLRVRCHGATGDTCAGTIYLRPRNRLRSRAGAAAYGRRRFAVPANTSGSVALRVPGVSRAALRVQRKAVALAVVEPAGNRASRVKRLITLIAKRR